MIFFPVRRRMLTISAVLLSLGLAPQVMAQGARSPVYSPPPPAATNHTTVYDVVKTSERLREFDRILQQSGLAAEMEKTGPYTLLAPPDEAFAAMGNKLARILEPGREQELRDLAGTHVVRGYLSYDNLRRQLVANGGTGSITTFDGRVVSVLLEENGLVTLLGRGREKAILAKGDVPAFNGTVLTIGAVLMPPKLPKS